MKEIQIPTHEDVRGDYGKINTIPDAHPDSLYMIATGKGLMERNLDNFSFNDLMFMYEVIKKYGLRVEPHGSEKRKRLQFNFGLICDKIREH